MGPGVRTRADVIIAGLIALGIAFLALLLLANSMARSVSHDEQMYCTGGVLTAAGKVIYRDFSYIAQPPYHAALLAAFYKLTGTHHYLLVGRLISVACDILVVVFIVLIYRSIFGRLRVAGSLLGLAAAALCVFNPVLNFTAGLAWNHDPVMACVMASLWLFIRMPEDRSPNRYLFVGIIVVLLTFATCMRITAALIELVFFVAIVAGLGGPVRRRLRATAVFAGIAVVTAAWFVWVLLQAPHAVLLNMVRIPVLCGQWLHQVGMALDKRALTQYALTTPAYVVLLVLVGTNVVVFLKRWPDIDGRTKRHFILMTALVGVFVLIAFIPPTMWLQYWGAPVPFLSIMMAYPLAEVVKSRMKRIGLALVACGVVCVVVSNPALIGKAAVLLTPERWTPVQFHKAAEKIAAGASGPKRVLTLGPLYALEAGEGIYIELACADFSYRVADQLSPEERRITHTVGQAGLNALTVDQPPDAVLVGMPLSIPELETPLRAAIPPSWSGVDCGNNLRLYVQP